MAKGKYQKWLEPESLLLLEGWARDGLTDKQIAHNIGISEQTLNVWKNNYPSFSESLKKGKEVADYIVENALFRSAIGYDVEEEEEKVTASGKVVNTKKKRHIPASTVAQIFWLKNRRPDKWRDKPIADDKDGYEDDGLIDALKNSDCKLVDDMEMVKGDADA